MGSRLALFICLNLILLICVSCRPQKQQQHTENTNRKTGHSHPVAVMNSAGVHTEHVNRKIKHSHPIVVNSTGVRTLDDANCPRDAVKMGVCVDLLADLLSIAAGKPGHHPCCSALFGFMDIEAAVCLCTTIKGSFLGITIDMPIKMTLLLNFCGKSVPKGFLCA